MKRKTFLTILFVLVAIAAGAQETADSTKTKGRELMAAAEIKDHLTHEAVKGVKGELLWAADSSMVDTLSVSFEEGDGWKYTYFLAKIKQPGQYLARLNAEGYQTKYVPIDIKKMYKREKYRALKTAYLRKLPKKQDIELDEVVVRATKLKFYMDGDTLVYDADAFQMAEGSMLDALIKKLPGVELEDGGVIKVNGRKVDALLLNGKDFFDSDRELLLENMPSYMVKDIQSYERVPRNVKGTNLEKTARKELVMNVKLKREYATGWIANADIGAGLGFYKNERERLDGKYLGRLFGLRFTDKSRLALYANSNNLNDAKVPGEKGDWSPLTQSEGLSKRIKVGGNFRLQPNEDFDYQGSADFTYYDKTTANNASTETFLEGGNTFGRSFYQKRSYDYEIRTEHELRKYSSESVGNLLKYFQFDLRPSLRYLKWNNHTEQADATLKQDVADQLGKDWMDSIQAPTAGDLLRKYAINRTITRSKGIGHYLETSASGYTYGAPAHNDYMHMYVRLDMGLTDRNEDNYNHYLLDYPSNTSLATDRRNRYNPQKDNTRRLAVSPSFTFYLDNKRVHSLNINYSYRYNYSYSNSPLYLLNKLNDWAQSELHPLGTLPSTEEMLQTLDQGNSSRSKSNTNQHIPGLSYSIRFKPDDENKYSSLDFDLSVPMTREKMEYQKGTQVDTLMRRNTHFLSPRISYYFNNWKKGTYIYILYNMSTSAPSMTSLLNIRDDANPLYVTLGNPNLKNTQSHRFQASYRDKWKRTLFNADFTANITRNAVASSFIYNKQTGVRTTTPENVNGNWQLNASSGIDFPLDKDDKWRIKENIGYDFNNSVDLSGTDESIGVTRSVVKSNNVSNNTELTWRPTKKMEYGLGGKLNLQHSTSERADFTDIHAWTFQYGVRGQIELPWNIQLSTDLTMYSRRGYSDPSMNTNELVWNARVAKRLMKGNLTIMFDGFDLLGKLSNVRRYINAQGKSETFYNVIPSYGLLHVVWRLNKEPKKNQ